MKKSQETISKNNIPSNIQIIVFKYHFTLKEDRAAWRNGWFQGWANAVQNELETSCHTKNKQKKKQAKKDIKKKIAKTSRVCA